MPFNGSGTFNFPSLPGSWNPAISGQQATPDDWNTLAADLTANGLTNCITKDGQTVVSADIPFAGFRLKGVGNAVLSTDAVNAGQVIGSSFTAANDTGVADAYAIAPTVATAAYAIYQRFQFVALHANTTASTLAVSGLAAKAIKRPNGDALSANDILAGAVCDVIYDGTNFILMDGGTSAIAYSLLTARGDVIRRGATAPERVALGSVGQALVSNGTDAVWALPAIQNYLTGLTLSTAGGSGTFGIAAGQATDSTNVAAMALASAYTKTTSSWAVGTGNGSLDTGTIANSTWYHVWLIERPDTGVVDVLTSLSATAPTMPANYTLKRRIGSMLVDGSTHWTAFIQNGDTFYIAGIVDVSTGVAFSATLTTLSVPTGIVVKPIASGSAVGGGGEAIISTGPTTAMMAPLFGLAPTGAGSGPAVVLSATNTSAQVYVSVVSPGLGTCELTTWGWVDARGKDG